MANAIHDLFCVLEASRIPLKVAAGMPHYFVCGTANEVRNDNDASPASAGGFGAL